VLETTAFIRISGLWVELHVEPKCLKDAAAQFAPGLASGGEIGVRVEHRSRLVQIENRVLALLVVEPRQLALLTFAVPSKYALAGEHRIDAELDCRDACQPILADVLPLLIAERGRPPAKRTHRRFSLGAGGGEDIQARVYPAAREG
jgi:hypothetical protein